MSVLCRHCTGNHGNWLRNMVVLGCHGNNVPGTNTGGDQRFASSWKRRLMKVKERKSVVFQYAGKNTRRTARIYGWGWAGVGALGIRSFLKPEKRQLPKDKQLFPRRLDFFDKNRLEVYDVSCGYGFTVFLCREDKKQLVFGTGINTESQLGFQEYPRNSGRILDYVIEPARIELPLHEPGLTKLLSVACGRAHTLVLTDREGVFSLGNNAYGQCGQTSVEGEIYRGSQSVRKVQLGQQKISQIVCGQDHSLLLTEGGEVFSCGLGADGQTGLGHYDSVGQPQKVEGEIKGEKIVQLASRADCVLAVSEEGDVFGWGNSEYNQLASVAPDSTQVCTPQRLPLEGVGKVKRAASAGSMCALVNDEGDVFVWGYGILGKGPRLEDTMTPSCIPPTLFGRNQFSPDTKVTDISAGISYFAAWTNKGDLFTWGRNKSACLGLGNLIDQYFPYKVHVPAEVYHVACGVDHTVTLCKSFA